MTPRLVQCLVLLAIAAFVGLGSLWISIPGLHYDESLFVMVTHPQADTPIEYTLQLGGRSVPVMIIRYLGALKGWLYLPILKLGSGSPALVRLPALALGAAGLCFLYLFCRRALGWQAAFIALALAATDPIYLFTTRMDWGPVAIQRLCLLAGCWGVLRWWQEGRLRDLAFGFLVFGLGVFDKATFLWLLVALILATALVFPRWFWRSLRPRTMATAFAGLALGAAPFLLYHWKSAGQTFRHPAERAANYAEKLPGLLYTLEGTMLIGWISREMDGQPLPASGPLPRLAYRVAPRRPIVETLMLPAVVLSLLLLPLLRRWPAGRGILFACLFCLLAFAQMVPIRDAGQAHHLALLLPFPQILVAAGVAGAGGLAQARLASRLWRGAAAALLWLAVATLMGANLRSVAHHYFRLLGYGGGAGWSEAIYSLHRSLEDSRAQKILLLDWGMGTQLRLLSGGILPVVEADQPQGPVYDARHLEVFIRNPQAIYVEHHPGEPAAFPQIAEAFRKRVEEIGYRRELLEIIRDRRGRPIFEIFAVRPRTAINSPPGPPC